MTRAHLAWPLALALAACGGTPEPTNRDRLPRRAPAAQPASPEPPSAPETPGTPETTADGPFRDMDEYARQREDAVVELEAAIGTPEATRVDGCKTVAVGEKACGGPRAFAVYAASGATELDVLGLAGRVTALDRAANEQFGLASDCAVVSPPAVRLVGGVCTAD